MKPHTTAGLAVETDPALASAVEHHALIKRLFDDVCELSDATAQRDSLRRRGVDERMSTEVMALLAHVGRDTRFSGQVAQAAVEWLDEEWRSGDVLGNWTLQGSLGQGGMGQVFLAVRSDGQYEQRAAVKLLRGWSGADAAARFGRERQILADLNHPHIARLLDGGTTPGGRPYLVMELVEGEAIDVHCAQHSMGLADRLALFDSVCSAVAFAHRQGVIHCDIKPGNVWVGADRLPKLLDFGIARMEGQDDDDRPAMTPGYASPEQLAGHRPGPASDVFALGRLLDDLVRPLAASPSIARELAGIVAMATADTASGRYDSVDALRRDLGHLLTHRPVVAMAGGWSYVVVKLVRRRWPWVLAGTAAFAMAVAFTWRLAQERDHALAEGRRAQIEAENTRETSRLLMSLFTGADPKQMRMPDLPKSIVLDRGRAQLKQQMANDPALRARLQAVLGDVYERVGQGGDAITSFAEAAELFGSAEIDLPLAQADSLRRLALALSNAGRIPEAEGPARLALRLREQHDPDNLPDLADAENRLGIVLMNLRRHDEAAVLLEHALALRTRVHGPDDPESTSTLHNLARLNHRRGALSLAESQLRRVVTTTRRTVGALDDRRLGSVEAHGSVLSDLQRHAEAKASLQEAVDGWSTLYGADNANVGIARHKLSNALRAAGQLDAALAELQLALQIESRTQSGPTLRGALMHVDLARIHAAAGRLDLAEQEWREGLAREAAAGAPPLTQATTQHGLAQTLLWQGRPLEAQVLLAQSEATRARLLGADDRDRVQSQLLAAELALALGQGAGAEERTLQIEKNLPPQFPALRYALMALRGHAATQAGNPLEAARWLGQAWQASRQWRDVPHPELLPLGLDLLAALRASAQPEAEAALLPELHACAQAHDEASPWRMQLQR